MGDGDKVSEVMVRALKVVCGECEKGVSNPWVIGHEKVIGNMLERVDGEVNERNECNTAFTARRILRTRMIVNARNMRYELTS